MQAVELICVCCLCCIKVVQCSCKDRQSRRVSMPFFFVVSLLMIGGLIWSLATIGNLQQQNQALDADKQTCAVICGEQYIEKGSFNMCCWQSANDCRTKQQCQQDWDAFYSTMQIVCKVFIAGSAVYAVIFVIATVVKIVRKFRAGPEVEPLLMPDEDYYDRINASGDTESRLRESIVIRDSNLCSICLEGYQDQRAISLDCGHMYHSECIRIWVRKHNTCPLCRGQI